MSFPENDGVARCIYQSFRHWIRHWLRPLTGVARLACGLLFGLLISLPEAIITNKYVPILVLVGIGGLVIGENHSRVENEHLTSR